MEEMFVPADCHCNSAIIVSDMHLRIENPAFFNLIAEKVKQENIECIVFLGDLFDDFHRRAEKHEVVEKLISLIKPLLGQVRKIVYITSRSSHDPIISEKIIADVEGTEIYVYPHPLRIQISGIRFYLTHGEIVIPNGAVAFVVNTVAALLGRELYIEKKLKERIRSESSWLVMGHTHIPGIDYEAKVANTGSWRSKWLLGLPYWRRPTRTGVLVKNSKVKLVKF